MWKTSSGRVTTWCIAWAPVSGPKRGGGRDGAAAVPGGGDRGRSRGRSRLAARGVAAPRAPGAERRGGGFAARRLRGRGGDGEAACVGRTGVACCGDGGPADARDHPPRAGRPPAHWPVGRGGAAPGRGGSGSR